MSPAVGADAPSPSPSAMPPPASLKRPRPTNGHGSGTVASVTGGGAGGSSSVSGANGGTGTGSSSSRTKRRKPEGSVGPDSVDGSQGMGPGRRGVAGGGAGVGVSGKGKEREEDGEERDFVPLIDFKDLPTDTLYRYLEVHDLLPRWDPSPWSEDPCTPPNMLYSARHSSLQQPADAVAEHSTAPSVEPSTLGEDAPVISAVGEPVAVDGDPASAPAATANAETTAGSPSAATTSGGVGADGDPALGEDAAGAAPTTRSKTAPYRKAQSPPPTPSSDSGASDQSRGVITLADVDYARDILAEKANAHWIKGLGGGQNKEGETIVNFLYKLKVGHGRLLRVYKPAPPFLNNPQY